MDASTILKKLLEPYPAEIQVQCWEAVERLHIRNPDDPIFELMVVLGTWGTYYQKISGQIVETGRLVGNENAAALSSLDERVRVLQGLAQIIQQASDRLGMAGAEIVESFPVDAIARQVINEVDSSIRFLPLPEFTKRVEEARKTMEDISATADKLGVASETVRKAASSIINANLPRVSIGWAIFWLGLGAAIAVGVIWLFTSATVPEIRRIVPWIQPQPSGAVIIFPGDAYQSASRDSDTHAITIQLKP